MAATESKESPIRQPWVRKPIPRWFTPPTADDVLLRTEEVSAWLGISKHTLRWWRNAKRGPSHIAIEGKPRYYSGEVRRYIRQSALPAALRSIEEGRFAKSNSP